nr:hypothetical protein GCM10020093_088690 [Planobispora longispora]
MDHANHTTLLQAGGHNPIPDRMRELLARAAQDHVYEKRTQGAVLDELRQRLEGMEWLLREVRERELSGLNGTLESVHGRLDDIAVRPPSWAESLAQHVEAVRDHVDVVGERVDAVGERVGSAGRPPARGWAVSVSGWTAWANGWTVWASSSAGSRPAWRPRPSGSPVWTGRWPSSPSAPNAWRTA